MVLIIVRKLIFRFVLFVDKVIDSGYLDDMSFVSENLYRYDYGKFFFELDVLLVEGGKDVGVVFFISNVECLNLISFLRKDIIFVLDYNRDELLDFRDN